MAKRRLKLIVALLLVALGGGASLLAVRGAGELVAYFQDGADPAAALTIVPNVPPDLHVALRWRPDDPDIGEAVSALERETIGAAYLSAWLHWNLSYAKGEPYGLGGWFAGPALRAVGEEVRAAADQGLTVEQVDIAHTLRLRFLGGGGAIAVLRDEPAEVAQLVRDGAGVPRYAGESRAAYDVIMVRSDGRWKVYNLVRAAGELIGPGAPPVPASGFVRARGEHLEIDGERFVPAGINYYPAETPWDRFWPEYDPEVVAADFARIKSLGLNTVRVFVPFEQFGGPRVRRDRLDDLGDLLDQAEAGGLRVIVTLFDFRVDYSPLLWPQADRHLEALLTRFREHRAVLAWDLKNEPDRDDGAAGPGRVDSWLAHTARLARVYAPHHLITVGWSTAEAAPRLAEVLDIISFHYYLPADGLPAALASLRATAPGRPVVLQEFGLPTWSSPFFPGGHTEAEQALYYAEVLAALRADGATGSLAWTLYDFEHVPGNVAGRLPWQTGPQSRLGVLRADGSAKPAAAVLAPDASLDVPRPAPWARFAKPFWLLSFSLAALALAAAAMSLRRRRPERQ
jgi:hypothetical protein